ncbi:hypothetical protein MBLNU230_g5230t1 [Neophaeotheca triangularis]
MRSSKGQRGRQTSWRRKRNNTKANTQAESSTNDFYKQNTVSDMDKRGGEPPRGGGNQPTSENTSFEALINKHANRRAAEEAENPNKIMVAGRRWMGQEVVHEKAQDEDGEDEEEEDEESSGSEFEYEDDDMTVVFPSRNAITLWKRDDSEGEVEGGEVELAESRDSPAARPRSLSLSTMPPPPLPLPKPYREKDEPSTSPKNPIMGAVKRLSNGETKLVGPHPSTIRVSAQYMSQSVILGKLFPPSLTPSASDKSLLEAREDSWRLQGVSWLDNIRRSLQLPVRTFTTACVYYHKFRLAQPAGEYNWMDACAASLLTACKNEDTLKKSRDILAASYNLKAPSHEHLGADDPIFEAPSRVVIGLERLVLESSGFDFRTRSPHQVLAKLAKTFTNGAKGIETSTAFVMCTDAHRTFAPLKQSAATLAFACLELSARLTDATTLLSNIEAADLKMYSTTRPEIMETLLDLLDLYTHHTTSTILGTRFSLDDFLRIRLHYNAESTKNGFPRFTPPLGRNTAVKVANGHPTPVSPPQVQTATGAPPPPEDGGTLRFMLEPQRAVDEKAEVQKFFTEEWEDYEEEIEVPVPRHPSSSRRRSVDSRASGADRQERFASSSDVGGRADRSRGDRGRDRDGHHGVRDRERERLRAEERDERDRVRPGHRERERERERGRDREGGRDRERERRYVDERRYEDRERRYEDRRGERGYERERGRYEDRHGGSRRSHR